MADKQRITFSSSQGYSLGVEIEFQIIDQSNFNLVPLGPTLQQMAPKILQPRISQELIKSILEIQTGICRNLRDVENDLLQTCSLAEELAADHDCLLYAASLHPFARADEQERSSDARYQAILQELQIIARRFISQGLHVHVGVPDGSSAIQVCNAIQPLLPLFLALSTSSPYFQGEDTGLKSYRTKLFESLPLAGGYEFLEHWDHFSQEVSTLINYGVIQGPRDLWWDARPNPQFGTVEVRICDLPSRFKDILAIVAMIQAVVAWIIEKNIHVSALNSYLLKANKWQALRHGLEGRFIDPTGYLFEDAVEYKAAVYHLVDRIKMYSNTLNSEPYLAEIENIIIDGTGADKQRRIYRESGDFTEVVRVSQQDFWS